MIQVLVLLQSAVDHKASVISEMKIVNDGTGNSDYGNYDVELIPSDGTRVRVRVEDFRRDLGCEALLMEALMTINEQDDLSREA
jgi:hypothetical protein